MAFIRDRELLSVFKMSCASKNKQTKKKHAKWHLHDRGLAGIVVLIRIAGLIEKHISKWGAY